MSRRAAWTAIVLALIAFWSAVVVAVDVFINSPVPPPATEGREWLDNRTMRIMGPVDRQGTAIECQANADCAVDERCRTERGDCALCESGDALASRILGGRTLQRDDGLRVLPELPVAGGELQAPLHLGAVGRRCVRVWLPAVRVVHATPSRIS